MLDGKYLWDIPDSIVELWEELENWAIEDIIERILMMEKKNQTGISSTAAYRFDLLKRMGMDMNEVYAQLSEYTKKSEKELKELFIDAGAKCLENDNMVFLQHGIKDALTGDNGWVRQLMEAMYQKTCGEMKNFTGTFARGYQKTVIDLMDKAYTETTTGMKSHSEAVADAIDDLGRAGITTVEYDKGHTDTVETAVRRAVITGINRTAIQISLENAKRLGADYVVISSHLGARVSDDKVANHAGWQGKIYKIEGSDKTASNLKEETGYPDNPLGLGGYNCRHNIFPYFPGDPNPFKQFDKTENEKAYRLSQQQRAKERAIRKSKRELLALNKGMETATDEETRAALKERYDKASFLYAKRNEAYNKFCEDNNLKTKSERLKVAKWNRSQARKAGAGAQRYILEKQTGAKANSNFKFKNEQLFFDNKNDYTLHLKNYSEDVNEGLSKAAADVAQKGSRDRCEHMHLVNLKTGKIEYYETNGEADQVGYKFGEFLMNNPDKEYAFVHNHNIVSSLSLGDLVTPITHKNILMQVAVQNDGVKYVARRNRTINVSTFIPDIYYEKELMELNNLSRSGKITPVERLLKREEILIEAIIKDFYKDGVEVFDGKK